MRILFAPSEAKTKGGKNEQMQFCLDIRRDEILKAYDTLTKTPDALKLYGTKEDLHVDIFNSPTKKAIERYSGVAYEYLGYASLSPEAQNYIDEHLIIFSNLFGPICAKDLIPYYKLKQGNPVGEIKPERYYKERLKDIEFGEEILDLRAGYYEKFYKPKYCIKMKFIKDGKVVSHWAKAYRGMVLRQIAKEQIATFNELRKVEFEGLKLIEIQDKKDHQMWVFETT